MIGKSLYSRRMKMIGTTELLLIGLLALVFFGSTRLPKFFRSLGKARKEFEKGLEEGKDQED